MSYEPSTASAASKVSGPGIFLIVTGILNILTALALLGMGAFGLWIGKEVSNPNSEFSKEFNKGFQQELKKQDTRNMTPQQRAELEKYQNAPGAIGDTLGSGGIQFLVWGIIALLASLVSIIGAVKMRSLQSYGLSMTGAILTAIPGISPCCILGQIAGIWGIVVLLNEEVKAGFNRGSPGM